MGLKPLQYNLIYLINKIKYDLSFETELKWRAICALGFMHVFGSYWSYHHAFPASWQTIAFAYFMYLFGGFGITCGVHRLWTHKSYKAVVPVRVLLMLMYASVGQNSIYEWVRDHRLHHKFSDSPADPHDATRGFWFSHIGWLLMKKNQLVIAKGRQIDMSDLETDPVAMFEHKYHRLLCPMCAFIVPTFVPVWLWGETWQCSVAWLCFIRFLCVLHAEMTVNSFAHIFGYKPYDKNIRPTQNMFVSLITVGEGWHNYHHAFPSDYRAAETLDFMNLSTKLIKFWAKIGLAYDLREASPQLVLAAKMKNDNKIK